MSDTMEIELSAVFCLFRWHQSVNTQGLRGSLVESCAVELYAVTGLGSNPAADKWAVVT